MQITLGIFLSLKCLSNVKCDFSFYQQSTLKNDIQALNAIKLKRQSTCNSQRFTKHAKLKCVKMQASPRGMKCLTPER